MKKLAQHFNDFLELFYPSYCLTCGDRLPGNEKLVCFQCWSDLPVTNFNFDAENKVAQLFWGRVQIENATSFFSYKKGSRYQHLIHQIKYKGFKELGFELGQRFGFFLKESENFASVSAIIPVPLHPRKLKKRGFNQSEWIANGISEITGLPVVTGNLYREIYTTTQTRKTRYQRFQNVEGIFKLNQAEKLNGKHILLVDDVVTTGSTLEACAFPLLENGQIKVSIATLAFADF
jgi:ComF family protein